MICEINSERGSGSYLWKSTKTVMTLSVLTGQMLEINLLHILRKINQGVVPTHIHVSFQAYIYLYFL